MVTGGGTGIGRAVAAAFAKQGDKVVILGRRAEVLQQTAGELGVRWRQADVSRREEVEAAVRWVVADVGPAIDVLVNNAGGVRGIDQGAPLEELDLGPQGITVNAVAPGFIEDTEFFGGGLTAEGRRSRVSQIPACRPGRPEEVAAAIAWLAAPEAAYVNGEVHHVNGGWLFGR